ncbi:alpha,alpha-trehalose-phosphate synthase (UDP-forming) [Sulfobacillus harzensis]|uniref:Trehalose-6-phosphate synthase n=1 Tax=Sulfobacillus harzensis TaxID=2729629 RepID=A0A7Y0L5L8_9FIRM|nr:trehalose-6-phosphate synthase [Sulfobacillus harzensis]NMP23473.1 trehalose-6-phosphate synthase [Sulfobacillus harzensis]
MGTVPTSRPLVIVTNREPYVDEKTKHGIRVVQKAGGVVSALDPMLREVGGDWVAWGSGSADRMTAPGGVRPVPPKNPRYRLHRIYLSPDEVSGFYNRYSNQGLWPLCHMLIERVQFSRQAYSVYRAVNAKFARKVARESQQRSLVFSHDYQLALFPSLLRQLRPDLAIAHFWHIPWPAFTVYRRCPQYQEILRGLMGADVLGFQTSDDVDAFLTAVSRTFRHVQVDRDNSRIHWQGRAIEVRAFPISVDIEAIEELVQTPRITRLADGIRHRFAQNGNFLGVSVDRADYTKGIIPRLEALQEFFSRYPHRRGQVNFLQVVVPTRSEVQAYRTLYRQVEDMTRRINEEFGQEGWMPVTTIRRSLDRPRVMALFRAADFAIISSLFDGMNLVAKEFVSAQVDKKGVLLLSESTGAAQELESAIHINPWDPEGCAASLEEALSLSPEERQGRMNAMRRQIHQHTLYDWVTAILTTLDSVTESYVQS